MICADSVSTLIRAEAAALTLSQTLYLCGFQLSAARRRLHYPSAVGYLDGLVSTLSRAEAAAILYFMITCRFVSFNTQPRGGGCTFRNRCAYSHW